MPVLASSGTLLVAVAIGAVAVLPTTTPDDGNPLASASGGRVVPPAATVTPTPTASVPASTSRPHHHVPDTPESVVVMGDSNAWTLVHYLPATAGR